MNNITSISNNKILRGPYTISLDITNNCNFRCLHCYNRSGKNAIIKNELTDEEVIQFIIEISSLGLNNFCFCGGEPLLRKELLIKCARILKHKKVASIGLVTNGYLITKEIAKELHDAGINSVQVSLDGSTSDTHDHMRGITGSFQRAVNALKFLKDSGIRHVSSAFCPTSFNYIQFEDVYNICCKIGVDILKVQPLMLIGRATDNLSIKPSDSQYRKLISCIHKLKNNNNITFIDWSDPIQHIIKYRTISDSINPIINIRADGSICISPYLPISLGNIKKHSFEEYWNHGLGLAWKLDIVKNIATNINCIEDMGKKHTNIPVTWTDENIQVDLIDDKLIIND